MNTRRFASRLPKTLFASSVENIVSPIDNKMNDNDYVRNTDISDKEVIYFMRNGHLVKRNLLNPTLLSSILPTVKQLYEQNSITAWNHKVKVTFGKDAPDNLTVEECQQKLEGVDKADIPFMQLFNLWYSSEDIRNFVLSPVLGKVAAQLLGVDAVRIYQDSLFVKRNG